MRERNNINEIINGIRALKTDYNVVLADCRMLIEEVLSADDLESLKQKVRVKSESIRIRNYAS